MDNSSINPAADDITPQSPSDPPQPLSLVNGVRVIQPLTDMSAYSSNQESVSPGSTSQTISNSLNPARSIDASKIYPDVRDDPTPTLNNPAATNNKKAAPNENQRVSLRVPSLQIYALFIIIYSLYTVFTSWSGYALNIKVLGKSPLATPGFYIIFGVAAMNVAIGIYLLISKNIRTISALLTVLLILGGLSFLNSLVLIIRIISLLGVRAVISLLISAGLLAYLWNVKAKVDFVMQSSRTK